MNAENTSNTGECDSAPITGKFNAGQSWEKSSVFDLSNGWRAHLSYNQCYGEFVSVLERDGFSWHCCDGLSELPQFALGWVETVHALSNTKLVMPQFKKCW